MAFSVELLSYLSVKMIMFSMLSFLSFIGMVRFMNFENVTMTLLLSLLIVLSALSYSVLQHVEKMNKFMKRSEVHLDTAANKLTYIETRMDAAEGRLSDVIRHLYEAFQNFRISIGPQTWLDNQVADMYETFLGAQFRKFGKVEKMTWQVICSAAKSVSMVSLFYVRFEALVEMRDQPDEEAGHVKAAEAG